MSYFKSIYCAIICFCSGYLSQAQDVEKGAGKNPFTIAGNVGAATNFYTSNEPDYTRPSFAWNAYGNFIGRVNKVELPFSFIVEQYSNSHASPFVQLGISPTYKWATIHLGYRNISFSPLTFSGQSFKGVGVELNPKLFRFAAFYGRINKAINEDTSSANFRLPQYSRLGYGIKMGIGNLRNFIDLVYFHAKDDSTSASLINGSPNTTTAQENAVLGTSFKLTILKKIMWSGDAAISGLTQDLSFGKRNFDSSDESSLAKFINKLLPYNTSTIASYAGQSTLSFYTRNFNSNVSYRRVQPDFKSFGTPYIASDMELVSWFNSFSIVKGKLNVNTSLSQQHNNLNKKLITELRTQVGNININAMVNTHINLNLSYSGYILKQKNDIIPFQQKISQFNVSPSYNIANDTKLHFITGNLNLSSLKVKPLSIPVNANSSNLSSSINYTLSFIKKAFNVSLNCLYSQYKQDTNSYKSYGPTAGTSAQLLKNKNLNLQGSIGYFFNRYNNGINQKNITYSFNTCYRIRNHSFNLFANYIHTPLNPINDIIHQAIPYAVATKNVAGGLTYNCNF